MASPTAPGITSRITTANKTYDDATEATIVCRALTGAAMTLTGGSVTFANQVDLQQRGQLHHGHDHRPARYGHFGHHLHPLQPA